MTNPEILYHVYSPHFWSYALSKPVFVILLGFWVGHWYRRVICCWVFRHPFSVLRQVMCAYINHYSLHSEISVIKNMSSNNLLHRNIYYKAFLLTWPLTMQLGSAKPMSSIDMGFWQCLPEMKSFLWSRTYIQLESSCSLHNSQEWCVCVCVCMCVCSSTLTNLTLSMFFFLFIEKYERVCCWMSVKDSGKSLNGLKSQNKLYKF